MGQAPSHAQVVWEFEHRHGKRPTPVPVLVPKKRTSVWIQDPHRHETWNEHNARIAAEIAAKAARRGPRSK